MLEKDKVQERKHENTIGIWRKQWWNFHSVWMHWNKENINLEAQYYPCSQTQVQSTMSF
jgi:hypothetical protein